MTEQEQAVGRRIAFERVTRAVSLKTLGERTGMDKGNLSRIENGKGALTLENLYKIAEALEIEPKTLL